MTGTVLGTWDTLETKEMTVTALIYIQYWYRSGFVSFLCSKAKLNNSTLLFHDSLTNIGKWIHFTFFRLNFLWHSFTRAHCVSCSSLICLCPSLCTFNESLWLSVVRIHWGLQLEPGRMAHGQAGKSVQGHHLKLHHFLLVLHWASVMLLFPSVSSCVKRE